MAVLRQGGSDPNAGKRMTSTGYKDSDTRLCYGCGLQKSDDLFTINANGKPVCADCAGPKHRGALGATVCRTDCEDGLCVCVDREPEDGRLEDASVED